MNRVRELRLIPVCDPAESMAELLFQIELLLELYERWSLKKQLREIHGTSQL